jgi:hypothetical protein
MSPVRRRRGQAAAGRPVPGGGTPGGPAAGADDPVEAYLDELLVALRAEPRRARHTVAEIEAHLLDSAAGLRAGGLGEREARAAAVARMGPVAGIAGSRPTRWLTTAVRRRLTLTSLLVGGAGGVALGVAGLLALAVRAVWGASAIATPFPVGSYTAADCARWQRAYPALPDCVTAMTADHAADLERNLLAGAVLGLLALAARGWLRRRWRDVPGRPMADHLAGALLAALAALGLLAVGIDAELTTHGSGAGAPFSIATAAALAAAFLALRARALRPT